MSKQKLKLTKTAIEALATKPSNYVAWDTEQPGFGVRVRANTGTKTFIAMYRVEGSGKQRVLTIASVGKLTVEEARKEAKKAVGGAVRGEDVAADRQVKKAELTVAELCDEYLLEGVANKKASTLLGDRGRIERHIKKLDLGEMKLSDVTRRDVERFMREVTEGKSAAKGEDGRLIVKGGKSAATRTVRLLGGIFTFAVDRAYIETNPRLGVKLPEDSASERFLTAAEFARLGEVLVQAETEVAAQI